MQSFILARERDASKITQYAELLGKMLAKRIVDEGIATANAEIVLREGLPLTDYGLATEIWVTPAQVNGAWTTYVNAALGQRRYSAHYGISNLSANPGISAVRYQVGANGANTMAVIPCEAMYAELVISAYFTPPVFYKPGEQVFIQTYGNFAQTERFVLRSLVAEPSGNVSAPRLETRMV